MKNIEKKMGTLSIEKSLKGAGLRSAKDIGKNILANNSRNTGYKSRR